MCLDIWLLLQPVGIKHPKYLTGAEPSLLWLVLSWDVVLADQNRYPQKLFNCCLTLELP